MNNFAKGFVNIIDKTAEGTVSHCWLKKKVIKKSHCQNPLDYILFYCRIYLKPLHVKLTLIVKTVEKNIYHQASYFILDFRFFAIHVKRINSCFCSFTAALSSLHALSCFCLFTFLTLFSASLCLGTIIHLNNCTNSSW